MQQMRGIPDNNLKFEHKSQMVNPDDQMALLEQEFAQMVQEANNNHYRSD